MLETLQNIQPLGSTPARYKLTVNDWENSGSRWFQCSKTTDPSISRRWMQANHEFSLQAMNSSTLGNDSVHPPNEEPRVAPSLRRSYRRPPVQLPQQRRRAQVDVVVGASRTANGGLGCSWEPNAELERHGRSWSTITSCMENAIYSATTYFNEYMHKVAFRSATNKVSGGPGVSNRQTVRPRTFGRSSAERYSPDRWLRQLSSTTQRFGGSM